MLIVATGSVLAPEETEGLTGAGWMEKVFTFYSLEGAAALRRALLGFDAGRLVINVIEMPIKCPVAHQRGRSRRLGEGNIAGCGMGSCGCAGRTSCSLRLRP